MDYYFCDSDFEELHEIEVVTRPVTRVFRKRPNYLSELTDIEFYERFRMAKASFCKLYNEIENFIDPQHSK